MNVKRSRFSCAEPLVSVVIPTYRREELTRLCLQSILRQSYNRLEALVIDQDPAQRLPSVCAEEIADARVVYVNLPNAGLSAANNHAIKTARGEILLFIDDDARARHGWIEAYVQLFQRTPRAGLAGGRNLGDWESPPPSWFPAEYSYLIGHYDLERDSGPMPQGHLPIGCNMGGPTELIRSAGGFDLRFGYNRFRKRPLLAGEDSLLSLRIERAGWELHYCSGATVDHSISARKISKKQFLRRNFWEAVTSVELLSALGSPVPALGVLRSQAPEFAMATARYLLPGFENRYALAKPQIRMMAARRMAYSAGVIYGAWSSSVDGSSQSEPPEQTLAPPYRTTIVTGGLLSPACRRTTGTASPGRTPSGTKKFT